MDADGFQCHASEAPHCCWRVARTVTTVMNISTIFYMIYNPSDFSSSPAASLFVWNHICDCYLVCVLAPFVLIKACVCWVDLFRRDHLWGCDPLSAALAFEALMLQT